MVRGLYNLFKKCLVLKIRPKMYFQWSLASTGQLVLNSKAIVLVSNYSFLGRHEVKRRGMSIDVTVRAQYTVRRCCSL